MTQTTPITVYTADCTGNASNCLYPNKIEITNEASAKLAFAKDLVCARYRNNYRSIDNFELSNALPGDCDNDHSDKPGDWVTPEDLAELFADVPYVIHYSRHHMKQKGNKGPRPRFHVVLLIQPERDAERYTALKQRLQAAFPFFDANALDAARFLFGTHEPKVLYHPGTVTLSDFLDEMDGEQSFADLEYSIPEGSRNSTMSRIGARIIKRYGDTAEAKDLFFQVAQQCSPPLEDRELESIWAGKQRLYSKICNQPGYIPPDAYNSTGPVVWDTPIPFDEYDLPTFPVDALPEVIRRYVLAVAESTQTSVDMAAVEALGVVSLCSQGKYFIRGNADWTEPLNTYTVVILPPAERKSSVLSMMIHPALTMMLAVQPEVLNGLMSNNTFRGRGLTARFLYSMPKSTVGNRSFSTKPIPEGVRVRYRDLIEAILSSDNEQQPISLDDGAEEVLESLFNEVEGRLKGDLVEISDWAGKFVGSVLRISGILHVMKYPKDSMFDFVDKATMESAVTIGRYFLEHAKAAYSLMGADATNKNAQYLLDAIKREGLAEFSRRDAMRRCRRFKTAESLQPVLNRLCEYGYIALKPTEGIPTLGRKPSEVYLTNPAVLEDTPGVGG